MSTSVGLPNSRTGIAADTRSRTTFIGPKFYCLSFGYFVHRHGSIPVGASQFPNDLFLFVADILIHAQKDLHFIKDSQKRWNDATCDLSQGT